MLWTALALKVQLKLDKIWPRRKEKSEADMQHNTEKSTASTVYKNLQNKLQNDNTYIS